MEAKRDMKWKYQEQFVVTAINGNMFKYEMFPVSKEKEARSRYAEFLVKYPNADVNIRKEEREVRSRMGRFRITDDKEYAVSVDDDTFYYKLPKRTMSDDDITKHLNNIWRPENE